MKLTFLGTGEALDTYRSNTSILVQGTKNLLIDCGYNIPQSLWKYNEDKDFLDYIVITHFHADHFAGLPIIFMKLRQEKREKPITIVGPRGTEQQFKNLLELMYKGFFDKTKFSINFVEIEEGAELSLGDFYLKLARGKHLTNELEVEVFAVKVSCGDKSFCYSSDTIYNKSVVDLAKNCDLLIHEAYLPCTSPYHNKFFAHSSPLTAAKTAKEANVKQLALVHLNRDYVKQKSKILEEASKEFSGKIILPEDGNEIKL